MKNLFKILICTSLLLCAYRGIAYTAEVEGIEDTDISDAVEKTINLKKESEFKFIPIIDITALGAWSKVDGSKSIGGANVKGSIAPALRLNKKNYIIPLYYGSYNKERQIVVEEEGGLLYNELMDHNLTVEYKRIIDENLIFKIDGLMRLHYVKEPDYSWDDGLYDYKDFGVNSNIEYFFTKTKSEKRSVVVGGGYYHRQYPNYKSLISLASVTAAETDQKDYDGFMPSLTYKYIDTKLKCDLMYSPLYKDFNDKRVIDYNGVLLDERRKDWFHYANIKLSYLPEESSFVYGLWLTGILVDSNQNYYDSGNTVPLNDDIYTKNYYSFKSLNINPRLTYMHKVDGQKQPATVTLGYGYTVRDYDERKAQDAGGTYTGKTELDQLHAIRVQGTYPLTEHISAVCTGGYTKSLSNMKYETYYRYNYESYFAAAGLRIKY